MIEGREKNIKEKEIRIKLKGGKREKETRRKGENKRGEKKERKKELEFTKHINPQTIGEPLKRSSTHSQRGVPAGGGGREAPLVPSGAPTSATILLAVMTILTDGILRS